MVPGDRAKNLGVAGPADRQESAVFEEEDAGLDGGGTARALLDGELLPGDTVIAAALEMDLPAWAGFQPFRAAAGQDGAIRQLHGFVLDGSQDAVGQPARLPPRPTVVLAETQHAPPLDRIRPDLVIKLQRAFLGLEQHRIPTRESPAIRLRAFGELDGRRPPAVDVTGRPDRDVRFPLGFSGEPSRDQRAILRLDDGRRVTARHRVAREDELRTDQARLSREGGESQAEEREQARQGHPPW